MSGPATILGWAVGPLAVAALVAGWVGVQVAWTKSFARGGCDPDALAGRSNCHGCTGDGHGACSRKDTNRPDPAPEPARVPSGVARERLASHRKDPRRRTT